MGLNEDYSLETVPLIALGNCSKEVGGTDSVYVILAKAEYMPSSTYFLVFFSGRVSSVLVALLLVTRYSN